MGLWSVTASLDGAVVATGVVQVEAARKKVQHLEGGIVKEVRVRDGDAVAEGDVLIRLDDTSVGANLRLVQGQSAELAIRRYRLLAERDGAAEIDVCRRPPPPARRPRPLLTSFPASARSSTRGGQPNAGDRCAAQATGAIAGADRRIAEAGSVEDQADRVL